VAGSAPCPVVIVPDGAATEDPIAKRPSDPKDRPE
jgi:hypothetical protein